jgi:hypothetical protein
VSTAGFYHKGSDHDPAIVWDKVLLFDIDDIMREGAVEDIGGAIEAASFGERDQFHDGSVLRQCHWWFDVFS